jgi:AraC-like DNA-binding protein
MLRTIEQRAERQQALKERNQEQWEEDMLTINDCARLMKCSRSTARRIFRHEPGVEVVRTPGSHRPIIRVPRSVYNRVMRRSANPWS